MARRTAKKVEAPLQRLTLRQQAWAMIREMGADGRAFTSRDLEQHTRVGRASLRVFVGLLIDVGALERVGERDGLMGLDHYRIVRDLGSDTPRFNADGTLNEEPTGLQRLWSAMRTLQTFTPAELSFATGGKVSQKIAVNYITALMRVDYLIVVEAARSGGRRSQPGRYRVSPAHNTGPLAPTVRRCGAVWDINLKCEIAPVVRS
jgi:hypothetical protein